MTHFPNFPGLFGVILRLSVARPQRDSIPRKPPYAGDPALQRVRHGDRPTRCSGRLGSCYTRRARTASNSAMPMASRRLAVSETHKADRSGVGGLATGFEWRWRPTSAGTSGPSAHRCPRQQFPGLAAVMVPEADALVVKLAAPSIGGGMDGAVPVTNWDLKRTPHVAESNRCSTGRRREKKL